MAQDIANLMDRMYEEKKFGTALFIADTCQAFTLFDKVTTPNVLALGTSLIGESAYAHHSKLRSVKGFPHVSLGFMSLSLVPHFIINYLHHSLLLSSSSSYFLPLLRFSRNFS